MSRVPGSRPHLPPAYVTYAGGEWGLNPGALETAGTQTLQLGFLPHNAL